MIPADTIKARKAELLGGEDEDRIDPETAGRFAFLDGFAYYDNPHLGSGPDYEQTSTAHEWWSGFLAEDSKWSER